MLMKKFKILVQKRQKIRKITKNMKLIDMNYKINKMIIY